MRQFVVRVDNKFTNEIKLKNGVSLILDTKFEPHKHRAFWGEVVELPAKGGGSVSIGDKLYFHHSIIFNENYQIADDLFLVAFDENGGYNSLCYAYEHDGTIHTLGDFIFLTPPPKEEVKSESGLFLGFEKKVEDRGYIKYMNELGDELGVCIGDLVGFSPNSDCDFLINDEKLWRMRLQDLTVVYEQAG
jgi:hypothetical protein